MNIEFSDAYLGQLWRELIGLLLRRSYMRFKDGSLWQRSGKNSKEVTDLQKRLVRDLDIKCLAVRHVVNSTSSPGVDGVKWRTSSEMMRAALSLTSGIIMLPPCGRS